MKITTGLLWDLLCSNCGAWEKAPGQRWCKFCKAAAVKRLRAAGRGDYRHLSPEARKKANVRSKTKTYQSRGVIPKGLCYCGSPAENHHPDYSKFKVVERLCKKHHLEVEKRGTPWPTPRSKAEIIASMVK